MWRKYGLLLLMLAVHPAVAETAYITDNLRLRMYANADLTGERIDTLESGQAFEVMSRNSQTAYIELPDGRQGYVSAAYIVLDPPAKLIVAQAQARIDELIAELASLKESFAEPAAALAALQQEKTRLETELAAEADRANELLSSNDSLTRRAESYAHSLPYRWVGGAIVICLVAGFLLGLWWTDRQSRKRHGGIRVY
ncbi:MAG: hypothetical protein ACE5F8_05415 [Woeseiaceae bacterium]